MIVTLGTRATLTLPADLRKELNLEAGDPLEVTVQEGNLVLTPVAVVPRSLRLTPKGEEKEAVAAAQIASGKVKRFANAAELLKDLHENLPD